MSKLVGTRAFLALVYSLFRAATIWHMGHYFGTYWYIWSFFVFDCSTQKPPCDSCSLILVLLAIIQYNIIQDKTLQNCSSDGDRVLNHKYHGLKLVSLPYGSYLCHYQEF